MRKETALVLLAMLATSAQSQTVYKCLLPDGKTSYQDKVCADGKGSAAFDMKKSSKVAAQPYYGSGYFEAQSQEREARADQRRQEVTREQSPFGGRRYSENEITEQRRRCNIENGSLVRSSGDACNTLRNMEAAVTGVPRPSEITVNNYGNNGRGSSYSHDQYGTQYNNLGGNSVLNTQTGQVCQSNGGNIRC